MGSAVDNLLFNLKLQFLALPSLARLGLLTFAGIIILREAFELAWRLYQHRSVRPDTEALPHGPSSRDTRDPAPAVHAATPAVLPPPDPLAQPSILVREGVKVPMPGPPSRPAS